MRPWRPSVHNKNRKGNKRSPWWMPLEAVMRQTTKSFIHLLTNLIFLITASNKDYSTLLCGLLTSSIMAIKPSLLELYFCKLWRVSKATKMLSKMRLLLVKALLCSIIVRGSTFLSQFAKTFENILYRTLHRLIGRNSKTSSEHLTFRMRVI